LVCGRTTALTILSVGQEVVIAADVPDDRHTWLLMSVKRFPATRVPAVVLAVTVAMLAALWSMIHKLFISARILLLAKAPTPIAADTAAPDKLEGFGALLLNVPTPIAADTSAPLNAVVAVSDPDGTTPATADPTKSEGGEALLLNVPAPIAADTSAPLNAVVAVSDPDGTTPATAEPAKSKEAIESMLSNIA
jgi:hypothetical protein